MSITEKYKSPIHFPSEFPPTHEPKELQQESSNPPLSSIGGSSQTAAADNSAAVLQKKPSVSSTNVDESHCEISESHQETEQRHGGVNSSVFLLANSEQREYIRTILQVKLKE